MADRDPIELYEVNVAMLRPTFGDKSYRHYCKITLSRDIAADGVQEAVDNLRKSFPEPAYKIDVYGVPYQTRYPVEVK